MAWASETAALETDTPFRFLALEIDLTDPDGVMPNSGQWPASLTLYLSDQYRHRTSAGAGYLTRYWGQVKDWGRFSSSIEPSTAFASVGDAQITLRNAKATNQEPASDITGPSTPTPEGVLDDLRFAQLCQLYKWKGAAVRVAVISVANGQGDQSVSGWGYRTVVWTGIIAETDFVRGDFVIDVIQANEHTRADLPGREIAPDEDNSKGIRVPIVYGNGRYSSRLLGNLAQDELLAVGVKPALTPAYYYRRDGFRKYFVWNDCEGLNSGWQSQPYFNTATDSPGGIGDYIIRYHPDADVLTRMIIGTNPGEWAWHDDDDADSDNELCEVSYLAYPTGIAFLPADYVVAESGLTDDENATDRNANTYAELAVDNTANYVHFHIPVTGKYGDIVPADGAIQAYVVVDATTVDASTELELGLWHIAGTAAYAGGSTTLTNTDVATSQLLEHSVTIATFVKSNYREPVMDWKWQYSDGTGTPSSINDLYVRVRVAVAGSAGQKVRIIAAGIRVQYALAQNAFQTWYPGEDTVTGQIIASVFGSGLRYEPRLRTDLGALTPLNADFYIMAQKSSLDDGSGTITGTGSQNIVHPVHIAHHLMRKWVDGLTGSDFETAITTFGTFAASNVDRLDRWIDQNVAGGSSLSWTCFWSILGQQGVDEAINKLCSETPMMIQRDPASGKFVCIVYENDSPQNWEKLLNSAGTQAYLHPNYYDRRGLSSDRGKPYGFEQASFGVRDGKLESIATGVRVRFRRFAPTGAYLESVYANPDEQKVWSETAGDYATGSSGTLYDACNAAETVLGYRTKDVEINADTIQDPATATGLLWYLVTRLTGAPIGVRGFMGAEGCLLKPGHYFRISDDTNLWTPIPIYGAADWVNSLFLCTKLELSTRGTRPLVYFEGVEWRYL